jgi:RNA polymerase sigma factor (TIGR02999 family)
MMTTPPSDPPTKPVTDRRPAPAGVTELLLAWGGGSPAALNALLPLVYDELHRQAARALRREAAGHTLQATALVHEAYLRLFDQARVDLHNRAQFFGVAARCMRRILVDHARARRALKRGGGEQQLTLAHAEFAAESAGDAQADVLALHEALERLAGMDPEQGRLVELRYFGGLSIADTAGVLGVSAATVKRDWAVARAWLRRELEGRGPAR